MRNAQASEREETTRPRTAADKLLVTGVVVAAIVVIVAAALIGWSVFGPKAAPRNQAERLLQAGLAAVASAPTSSTAHLDLGSAYFEMGQYDQAEKEFTAAQGLAKGSPVPLYDLAQVYRLTGRHGQAAGAFADVLSSERDAAKWRAPAKMFEDARFWLGVEYMELKRYAQVIDVLLPLMENKPLDADAAKTLARAYEATGDIEAATALYQRVLEVQPQDAEAAAALGRFAK